MCSNMCAMPVSPSGSCADPTSTLVKNENTGASVRSQSTTVRPLSSFLTVIRFSKEARPWAKARARAETVEKKTSTLRTRYFIEPPKQWDQTRRDESKLRAEAQLVKPCDASSTSGTDCWDSSAQSR